MSKSRKSNSHENSSREGAEALTPALLELLCGCLESGTCNGRVLADHFGVTRDAIYGRTQRLNDILGTRSLGAAVALLVREGKLAPPPTTPPEAGGGVKNNSSPDQNLLILGYALA